MGDAVIRIEGLSLWGYHGLETKEAKEGGPFELTVEAAYPEPRKARRDTLEGRPDYAAIADRAVELFHARRYRLVEPLAALIAEALLDEFPLLTRATVTVRKLRPILRHPLRHADITVSRER